MKLLNASVIISQTSDTDWTLNKTGEVDSSTVTWTITATEGNTVSGHLVVYGFMTVANTGACDTETITANSAVTAGWNNGDLRSFPQSDWGADPTSFDGAAALVAHYV